MSAIFGSHGVQYFAARLGSEWDGATWAGREVPGLVRVSVSTERKIDVANGPGLDGAQLRFQGMSPAEISVEVVLWTVKHDTDMKALAELVAPKKSKKPPLPYPFIHPALQRANILAIVAEKVDWYGEGPVPQSRSVKFACKEWVKPKKAVVGTPVITGPTFAAVEPVNLPPGQSGKANR